MTKYSVLCKVRFRTLLGDDVSVWQEGVDPEHGSSVRLTSSSLLEKWGRFTHRWLWGSNKNTNAKEHVQND